MGAGWVHARDVDHSHPLVDRLQHALGELGLDSAVDEDGDLEVEFEGNALFVHVAEDESAFRIFGRWEVAGADDEADGADAADEVALLRRCNDLSLELLLVTVSLQDGDLVFSVDHAVDPSEPDAPLEGVLPVLLENLLHGVETFAEAE